MVVLPAKLEIVSPDGSRKDIDIKQDFVTFGSHPKCSVTLKRPDISNEHAQILRNSEGYFLINMDGRNPVTLNSVPIRNRIKQKLRQNDVIVLGKDITITFKFGSVLPPSKIGKITSVHILIGMGILAFISILAILFLPKRSKPNSNVNEKIITNSPGNDNSSAVNNTPETAKPTATNQANANLQNAAVNELPKSNSNLVGTRINTGKYEAKMIGIISSISGKDNFVFRESFVQTVIGKLDDYKKNYPDFYEQIKTKSQDINRDFNNNGINPKLAYILAFSRKGSKTAKNLFGLSEAILRNDNENEKQTKMLAVYTKDLLGAFEQDYLKTIANLGISVSEAGKINADLNKSPNNYANSKIIDRKRFSDKELDSLAAFFAAGIVANSPWDFGLRTPEIGSLE